MSQVIIYTNSDGNVAVCMPTGELPIEQVLIKDCPPGAIIVDDSELPQDNEYFNAWELIDGKVIVNQSKKAIIQSEKQAAENAKTSALNKLAALGLTAEEIKALL
jgi:hypothetical protein